MRTKKLARGAALVAALAAALVIVPAGIASAHEEREIGPYTVAAGFGTEPAYAGSENSVQMFIHTTADDKAVVDLGPTLNVVVSYGDQQMDQMTMEPDFEVGESGTPGDYRAFFIPTRVGDYSFHFTGDIKGTKVDETFTSGPKTFSSVIDPSTVEFPAKDPTAGELATAVQRLQTRVNGLVAASTKAANDAAAASDSASSAKSLATVALLVGGVLGLAGIVLGAMGLAAARRARQGAPPAAGGAPASATTSVAKE
ncbi:MAG TPA: hypothetical protein VNN79_00485 [Actinomycetota bacterium]|nr:hypothetical protein [Actinomycetota bacterium]